MKLLIVVVALWLTAGCTAPEASGELAADPRVIDSARRLKKEYVIVPGDTFDVVVRQNASVSRPCVVRPDGFITLPIIDDVHVAGLTFTSVDDLLTKKLAGRLVEPDISVIATSIRPQMVYVMGEVGAVGGYELRRAFTAAQALVLAGGFKNTADRGKVAIIRLTKEGRLRALIVEPQVEGQPAPYMQLHNVVLQPDDLIFVPKSGIAQFDEWINTYINQPLSGLNATLGTVTNYLLIEDLSTER